MKKNYNMALKTTFFSICLLLISGLSVVSAQNTKIVIETDSGRIVVALYDNTPQHRDNMIKLVKEKFYDGTLFHRCIPGFVIQGGDPTSKNAVPGQMLGNGDLGYKIPAEINESNYHHWGALAMARDNNPEKASSACQFYIVTGKISNDGELDILEQRTGRKFTEAQRQVYKTKGGVPFLDGNYTVFGNVLEGMDVVEKIANMPRDRADRPLTDIRMKKVYLLEGK